MQTDEMWTTAIAMGIGATVATDAWAWLRRRLFGTPPPNWGLVGRWIGHFPRGRFRHDGIANSAAIKRERVIGWATHYAIGIAFACVFVMLVGDAWLARPALLPALAFGVATVAAPF